MITTSSGSPSNTVIAQAAGTLQLGFRVSTAKLTALPAGLEFPPGVRERIYFDDARHQLVFRGFMTKFDYDRLGRLSTDTSYLRAIEELFQNSARSVRDVELLIRRIPSQRRALKHLFILSAVVLGACMAAGALFWWRLH
jgi:hypothetical protein